jgi:hypothetical protein
LKDKQRKAAKRAQLQFYQNEQNKHRAKRQKIRIEKDIQAKEVGIPLRVLEMNNHFDLLEKQYANWPQPIDKIVANDALAKFRENTSCISLRELPCAICSGMFSSEHWTNIDVNKIDMALLEVDKELERPMFDIDFVYEHPYIDESGYKVLLDRNGFIGRNTNTEHLHQDINNIEFKENPFNLRVCSDCKRSLDAGKTPLLSLANMWNGPTPLCLEGLTIPEQLLISPGYLCMNLIQLSNRKHTHHKLKGHIVTLTQNPTSLTTILPLPMYRLCDHLKVVFVGQGRPSEKQLKKVLRVRKNKIAIALNWLINHNILYKDITLDKMRLASLPEDEVPTALMVMTVMVDIDPSEIEHYTGYTTDPIDNKNANDDLDNTESEDESDDEKVSDHFGTHNATNISELRHSGIIDTDTISVSEKNRTLISLEKIIHTSSDQSQSSTILMPHSNKPKNEYTDSTLLPAAFPVLFPYGIGGHEDEFRKQHIPFKRYINHLLHLHDPKFRHHRSFIFVGFNILQRREVSSETYLMAKQAKFEKSAELISKLTPNDIEIALEQERNKQQVTNEAILELLRNINIVGGKIMGSHQSRIRLRHEIRAVTIRDGLPSLFITINPADLHSPIVMMYAGKEIDINTLHSDNFPTATERARLAHLDSTAVAKYFNVVIKKTIEFILGYNSAKDGVFNKVKNYYGVIEYQDRGTPHCHMLIWLQGAPNPIELRNHLKNDENFRERLMDYMNEIIKEDISYLLPDGEYLTDEMLQAEYIAPKTNVERKMHPSFLPIPDPQLPDFDEKLRLDLLGLVKRTLFHRCTKSCKKYNRGGLSTCRYNFTRQVGVAPGKIYSEFGIIALQRLNAYINNHNPYITASCRGNNDIKFIAAVKLALAYIHYITDYITKSDASTHSSFLMCAVTLDKFLARTDKASKGFVERSQQFVTMCLNKITGQAELTGPQVSAYLLGFKDHYTPNKFGSIYLNSFEEYLIKQYPIEKNSPTSVISENLNDNNINDDDGAYQENNIDHNAIDEEMFTISTSSKRITAINLRIDYMYRGEQLKNMCLYDYIATIHKVKINDKELEKLTRQQNREGRATRVDRFYFLGGNQKCNENCDHNIKHPQHSSHIQVHWYHENEKVPILYGKNIPRKDDFENAERYGLCILMLFKPWNVAYDLRANYNSWRKACDAFLQDSNISTRLQSVIDNIELLHRCAEETILDRQLRQMAEKNQEFAKVRRIERSITGYNALEDDELEMLDDQEDFTFSNITTLDPHTIMRAGLHNIKFVDNAMLHLHLRGTFNIKDSEDLQDDIDILNCNNDNNLFRPCCENDDNLIQIWQKTIASRKATEQTNEDIIETNYIPEFSITTSEVKLPGVVIMPHETDLLYKISMNLNNEQKKVFLLVCDHCQRNYPNSPNKPSQLLMYLGGAGGTGKSKVIEAICKYFDQIGRKQSLVVCASTGFAASNISGYTLHSLCSFKFNSEDNDNAKYYPTQGKAKKNLQDRWANIEYVILDEVSMIGQNLLTQFHARVKEAKSCQDDTIPFAGLNIIFAGDFMQLPPVLDSPLYRPSKVNKIVTSQMNESKRKRTPNFINAQMVMHTNGRELWLSVKHVIMLKKQMRQINDPSYAAILHNLRHGHLTTIQREVICKRIITENELNSPEWKDAIFLVRRNDLRVQINFEATIKHARNHNQLVYYICAEDIYKKKPVTGNIRRKFLSVSDTKTNTLCGILPLSIGMKVALTVNICTNDGMANGAQGILREIIYDAAFPIMNNRSIDGKKDIILNKPPKYVVIEMLNHIPGLYDGLLPNHVPIYPIKRECQYTHNIQGGSKLTRKFQRTQLPITPGFAFTEFKCQGATLGKVVVDLHGGHIGAGIYVMLSRVQRLEDIMLLRPFDQSKLTFTIDSDLEKELKRFEECSKITEQLLTWPEI